MEQSIAPTEMFRTNKERKIRLILFLLTVICFCLLEFSKIQNYCNEVGYRFSIIEYAYLITACGANLPYTSIAYLLLLENINQTDQRISSNKLFPLVHKCFRVGLFASFCIVLFSFIPALFAGTWNTVWTEPLLISEGQLTDSIVPKMIYTYVSPMGGLFIGAFVLVLFWTSAGSALVTGRKFGLYHLCVALFLYLLFWNSIHLPDSSNFIPNWFFSLNAIINHTNERNPFIALGETIVLNLGIIIISVICNAAREHYCHKYTQRKVDSL